MRPSSRHQSLVLAPVLGVLLCGLYGVSHISAPLHSQVDRAPAIPDLTEAIDLSLDEVKERWKLKESWGEGPVAPDPSTRHITNTDSARAREADAEGKTLSWLAEQDWFDRRAFVFDRSFFQSRIQVGPHQVLGLWPPPWENRDPGRVQLTLYKINDDGLCIFMSFKEEATYQQVERVLLQLANGESPEVEFTIESYRPWRYVDPAKPIARRGG